MMSFYLCLLFVNLFIISKSQRQTKLSYTDLDDLNGFRARIYEDDGEPVIAFGNTRDNRDRVYCLQFIGFFEAENFNDITGERNKVSNSEIEFDDDVDNWVYTDHGNTTFSIYTQDSKIRADKLHFYFAFDEVSDGSYGMKFAFILENYQWISNDDDARYILDIKMKLCPGFSVDSSDSSDSSSSDSSDRARKLQSSSSDSDSDSDSSEKFSLDIAVFRNTPFANKICNGELQSSNVTVGLFEEYDDDDEVELELVYTNFRGCDLIQDPYVYIDTSNFGLAWWVILLIVLGSLIFVCGIILIIYKSYKKRNKSNSYADVDKQNDGELSVNSKIYNTMGETETQTDGYVPTKV